MLGARTRRFITAFTRSATGSCLGPTESIPPFRPISLRSILILPPTPRSSERSLSFGPSHQNLVHFPLLTHACHMPRPPHSLTKEHKRENIIARKRWRSQVNKLFTISAADDLPNNVKFCTRGLKHLVNDCMGVTYSVQFQGQRAQIPQPPNEQSRGNVNVDIHRERGVGTVVSGKAEGNIYRSPNGNTRVDFNGHWSRVYDGPARGQRNHGAGINFSHRW
jgi:hypothetical protein